MTRCTSFPIQSCVCVFIRQHSKLTSFTMFLFDFSRPRGYSPPGGVNQPLFGKYDGGLSNRNYLVAWTSSEDGGRGQLGYTYALQFPRSFAETSHQVDSLKSILLKKVRWNAVTRPVLNKNGTHMFVGVTGSELRGWVDDTRFDETASWAIDLVHTTIDPLAGTLLVSIFFYF